MSFIVNPSWIVMIASDSDGVEIFDKISGTFIDGFSKNLPEIMFVSKL